MAECRLRDVPIGGVARIVGIRETHQSYRRKLLSMGLTRGTVLMVRNVAPFGDPIHISLRDFDVSLRRDEADALVLELVQEDPADFGFWRPRRGPRRGPRHGRPRLGHGRHRRVTDQLRGGDPLGGEKRT